MPPCLQKLLARVCVAGKPDDQTGRYRCVCVTVVTRPVWSSGLMFFRQLGSDDIHIVL
jgi:hypothetical protein